MLSSARKHLRTVATLGVAGALVVGGVAVAQNDSAKGGKSGKEGGGMADGKHGKRGPGGPQGGPPGLGVPMKAVTYAEFHLQAKDGETKVIRIDQGTVSAVDSTSITVKEKDGSEVTIAVDDDTKVRGLDAFNLDDLETGQMVVVKRVDDGNAKSISVLPENGARKGPPSGRNG
jgi:hypothetical protein